MACGRRRAGQDPGEMQHFSRELLQKAPMTSLHTATGERKYLTTEERTRFLAAAERAPAETRALCLTLAWSRARISEVLELTPNRVDLDGGTLTFRSLKKRSPTPIFRSVPLPPRVLEVLDLVFRVRPRQGTKRGDQPLFVLRRGDAEGLPARPRRRRRRQGHCPQHGSAMVGPRAYQHDEPLRRRRRRGGAGDRATPVGSVTPLRWSGPSGQ